MSLKYADLSPAEARKLVLLSQGIHARKGLGRGIEAVLKAIERLGYVQIDTISVVARAHHHNLWNRVQGYQQEYLAKLQQQRRIFEYWSHAAAYLPMRDYRFSLPRKHSFADGDRHWHVRDEKLNRHVLERIRAEGPLSSRDFEQVKTSGKAGWWEGKPAKRALQQLFMEGELMIRRRQGFAKVFDLTERVLPAGLDTSMPGPSEYHQHLIRSFLGANGIGTPAEISYLRKGLCAPIARQCQRMLEDGQLCEVKVKQRHYYALANFGEQLSRRLSRSKARILSPFDNLLIQRKRTLELFDFDYQLECYVTAARRQYGYFCLPLLWGREFAGRMDARIDRKSGLLQVHTLHLETPRYESFLVALKPALREFLDLNSGHAVQLSRLASNAQHFDQKALQEIKRQFENI